jgi:trimeric autotransporter adhesin
MGMTGKKLLMLSVSAVALNVSMGLAAFAGERCMTNIATTSTDVVTSVGAPVAVTGTLGGQTAQAVTDTNFLVNPAIGPNFLTKDVGTAVANDVLLGDADLVNTTGTFVSRLPDAVNVVNSANVTMGTAIATVTPHYGEGPNGASFESTATGSDAFACGPGATATGDHATALGNAATATGSEATASGASATATGNQATASGAFANANGANATAVGEFSNADGANATAIGQNAQAIGANATAVGQNALATGANATAIGQDAIANGDATAVGQNSTADGTAVTAIGKDAVATGINTTAVGDNADAGGLNSTATGAGAKAFGGANSTATGAGALAIGSQDSTATGAGANASLSIGSTATGAGSNAALSVGSTATGALSDVSGTALATANGFGSTVAPASVGGTAYGALSSTTGDSATALGAGSQAGTNGTAVGAGTSANPNGSVAIGRDSSGNGATASLQNEFTLGTANHTYTAAGITSDLSRDRQSGPLEVATTDANGHLATDGGQIFRELGKQGAGIAIATAMENPDLVGNETFGLAANIGFFEGNSALSVSAMGVLGRDFMGGGERWAISGGVGVSLNENNFGGQSTDRAVAGRAGVQVSW